MMSRNSGGGEALAGVLVVLYLAIQAGRWVWSWISPVVEPTWPVDLALIAVLVCRRLLRGRKAKWAQVAHEMMLPAALGLGARLALWALLSLILSGIGTDFFAAGESTVRWANDTLGSVLGFRILGLPLFTFLIAAAVVAALFFARSKPVTRALTMKRYSGLAKATLGVMLLFAPAPFPSIDAQLAAEAAKRYRLALGKAAPAGQKAAVFDQLKAGLSHLDPQQRSQLLAPAVKALERADNRPDLDTLAQWDVLPEEPRSAPATESLADEAPSPTWRDVAKEEAEAPRAELVAAEAEKGFRTELIGALSQEFEKTFHKPAADGDLQSFAEAFVTGLLAKHAESIYDAYLRDHVRKGTATAAEFASRILERFGSAHRAWMEARATPPEPRTPSTVDAGTVRPEGVFAKQDVPFWIRQHSGTLDTGGDLERRRGALFGSGSDLPAPDGDEWFRSQLLRERNRPGSELLRERARPMEMRPRFVP